LDKNKPDMKRPILIFCIVLTALGLTAFGVVNFSDDETSRPQATTNEDVAMNMPVFGPKEKEIFTDFLFDVGPRFNPIKKTKVDAAMTIFDFLDAEAVASIVSLQSVNVALVENNERTDERENGTTATLTDGQLQLLQSFDYSTNFEVRAHYRKKNGNTGILVSDYRSPYFTIVPEKQAEYSYGKEAFLNYLSEESKVVRADVESYNLKAAKLSFKVTEKGAVEVIALERSSGYPEVDQKMIELISNLPGSWKPAEKAAGQKVNQEFVVSFGSRGC